jgi:hypothetical protein
MLGSVSEADDALQEAWLRLAVVLHDMFSVPFDEIAPIVAPRRARDSRRRLRRHRARADDRRGRLHRGGRPRWSRSTCSPIRRGCASSI